MEVLTSDDALQWLTARAPLTAPLEAVVQAPDAPGLYAIFVDDTTAPPAPFDDLLASRSSALIYLGKAGDSLRKRLGEEELRHKRAATFFRSLGAVLGYQPPPGSLSGTKNQRNYRFSADDTAVVIAWIDAHLRVRWLALPKAETEAYEPQLIVQLRPLLNLAGNPSALPELRAVREACRQIAVTAPRQVG